MRDKVSVSATINFFGGGGAANSTQFLDSEGNKINPANVTDLKDLGTYKNYGYNGFLLAGADGTGGSPLDGSCRFFDRKEKYRGFIGGQASEGFKIVVTGKAMEGFVIAFDRVAEEWATEIEVRIDGKELLVIHNDNPVVGCRFDEATNSFTICIKEWNKPDRPVRITSLCVGYAYTFSEAEIIKLEGSREMVADEKYPSYGVVGQFGKLELLDSSGQMLDFAKYGVLDNNLKCTITVKSAEKEETIGTYLTGDWATEYGKKSVAVDLIDETDVWNDISDEIAEGKGEANSIDLIKRFFAKVKCAEPDLQNILTTTIFQKFELKKGSITEQLKKVCELNQLILYKSNSGVYVLERFASKKSEGKLYNAHKPLYTIPPTKHNGTVKLNPMVNNKIDAVIGEYGKVVWNDDDQKDEIAQISFCYYLNNNYTSPYELPKNELFHEDTKISDTPVHEYVSKEILREYARGKQTIEATILSGDYQSVTPSGVQKKVINYIPNVGDRHIYIDENLKPYAHYVNGNPKEFVVTSVVLNYDKKKGISYKIKAQEISWAYDKEIFGGDI